MLKNLAEAMQRVFVRHRGVIARIPSSGSATRAMAPPPREAAREHAQQRTTERRQAVQSLAQQGLSQRTISRVTGFHLQTVDAYLGTEANAERQLRPGKKSVLAPYQSYLLERCGQGYWNAMGL